MAASTNPTRRVLVDDTSTDIQYRGPWFIDRGNQESGNFGPPFKGSQHGVAGSSANLSYEFDGSNISILGTIDITNSSGVYDPSWECFVDDESIGFSTPIRFIENNWHLCDWKSDSFGKHTISLRVTSQTKPFYIDFLYFDPSSALSLENALVFVTPSDPAIRYSEGWRGAGDFAPTTSTANSSLSFGFVGTGIEWYGYIPVEAPREPSTASYSIDGQPPISFVLKGIQNDHSHPVTRYNEKFFDSSDLPLGPHNLTVIYHGDATPLTLNHLLVRNITDGAPLPAAPSEPSASPAHGSTNTGAIVGGVIGALIALVLIIVAFIFIRRRHRKRNRPMIQPPPGYVKSPHPLPPLEINTVVRYSAEIPPIDYAFFAAEGRQGVRSMTSSTSFNPYLLQHTPTNTSNTDRMSRHSSQRSINETDVPSQLDPYSSGYPHAALKLTDYHALVAASKAKEAASTLNQRASYM